MGGSRQPASEDPAYPTSTPPDPIYPCQSLEPIGPPLDGVVAPALWSRLAGALERGLPLLWGRLGLTRRGCPERWASLHYGRLALNAHGWERLRAGLLRLPCDTALVPARESWLERAGDTVERLRLLRGRRALRERVGRAEVHARERLERAASARPEELDSAELARGPLDESAWVELLLPWLAARLEEDVDRQGAGPVSAAVDLEQRWGAELGRRLATRALLERPSDLAYLTVAERVRAVHGEAPLLQGSIAERRERVEAFLDVQLPTHFWGRPRVPDDKAR